MTFCCFSAASFKFQNQYPNIRMSKVCKKHMILNLCNISSCMSKLPVFLYNYGCCVDGLTLMLSSSSHPFWTALILYA